MMMDFREPIDRLEEKAPCTLFFDLILKPIMQLGRPIPCAATQRETAACRLNYRRRSSIRSAPPVSLAPLRTPYRLAMGFPDSFIDRQLKQPLLVRRA